MNSNTAFVFPGQGSQSIGMLADIAASYPVVQSVFSEVSQRVGYDLWDLVQKGPESKLNQTQFTQVAVLTADVALYRLLEEAGVASTKMMAGHSLGEYAALVCAGAISLPDAAELVATRGRLMQETVPMGLGAMAAIVGLNAQQVHQLCELSSTANEQVTPANFNSLDQIVIAGHSAAVKNAIASAEKMGARMAIVLPVSVPCHCSLLTNASNLFAESLQQVDIKVPAVSVISNVDLSVYDSVEKMKKLLKEQLYSPVRWVETIEKMKQNGIDTIVECGPGRVLAGLIRRIDKNLKVVSVSDKASLDSALTTLKA